MTKTVNPLKVVTGPDTRWSYVNAWEPKSINGGTPKYSVSLIIPNSSHSFILYQLKFAFCQDSPLYLYLLSYFLCINELRVSFFAWRVMNF